MGSKEPAKNPWQSDPKQQASNADAASQRMYRENNQGGSDERHMFFFIYQNVLLDNLFKDPYAYI